MAEQEPVIGIDLGTTNSVVAAVQGNQPLVIKNRTGAALTPSVVAVTRQGKRLVGQIAKRQAITNPGDTVHAAKRLIGRKFSSPEVQTALKVLPYQLVAGDHDDTRVMLAGQRISLPEISALVLNELRQDAEAHFGRPVSRAVITVPAYFNDGQRQATKDAGRIAGLEVLRLINEPTAAALAYGFGKDLQGKIAVFDLGGGTFDISVLHVGGDVFEVIAVGGDTYLGGEDFDARVIDWLVQSFNQEHHIDLRQDRMALQRLKDAAEKAKMELSSARQAQIALPFIASPPGGGAALHLQASLTREKLEELTSVLVDRAVSIVETVLKEAKVRPADLKEIILVGGQTRMPLVVERVRSFFGRDPCKGVHPDEVVALGAALQASALTSEAGQVLLLDVTPQSLGVAVAGGYTRALIPKNTAVPTSATEVFNTSKDNQTTVKIMVLQGEKELAHQNELLGEFLLTGLRQAPRGEVEIEVTFEIDSEGIVSVSARDRETGKRQSITVTTSGKLTEDELQAILEAQRDYLVAARSAELVAQRQAELEVMVRELRELIPRVRALARGPEASETIWRAEQAIAAAEAASREKNAPRQVTDSLDQLRSVSTLLKGLAQPTGSSRP